MPVQHIGEHTNCPECIKFDKTWNNMSGYIYGLKWVLEFIEEQALEAFQANQDNQAITLRNLSQDIQKAVSNQEHIELSKYIKSSHWGQVSPLIGDTNEYSMAPITEKSPPLMGIINFNPYGI
jgi:hypothetical protein